MRRLGLLVAAAVLLAVALAAPAVGAAIAPANYLPKAGDTFSYAETITLTGGVGNYTGYTEDSHYTGSITVDAVAPNATDAASYQSSGTYANNQGVSQPWSESGSFTFSASTFHYVNGTDNQTGYVDPYVWFYMDDALANGSTFYVLNAEMTVRSTDAPFASSESSTGYVRTIYATGSGSYQRDDSYGVFTATYQYQAYFDPSTGYIVGYVYTETDRDTAGDGFTIMDSVNDTHTSFSLTSAPAPLSTSTTSPATDYTLTIGLVVIFVILIVLIAVLVRRRSRAAPLPRHVATSPLGVPGAYESPPPLGMVGRSAPPVEQIVIRETVKVPCQYCGTLIDSTATVCPKCGATRT